MDIREAFQIKLILLDVSKRIGIPLVSYFPYSLFERSVIEVCCSVFTYVCKIGSIVARITFFPEELPSSGPRLPVLVVLPSP